MVVPGHVHGAMEQDGNREHHLATDMEANRQQDGAIDSASRPMTDLEWKLETLTLECRHPGFMRTRLTRRTLRLLDERSKRHSTNSRLQKPLKIGTSWSVRLRKKRRSKVEEGGDAGRRGLKRTKRKEVIGVIFPIVTIAITAAMRMKMSSQTMTMSLIQFRTRRRHRKLKFATKNCLDMKSTMTLMKPTSCTWLSLMVRMAQDWPTRMR